MEKAFSTISTIVGVVLIISLLVVARSPTARNALIDYWGKSFLSKEDYEAIKDPQTANKKAYEKMSRDAWENTRKNQPTWNQNWRK